MDRLMKRITMWCVLAMLLATGWQLLAPGQVSLALAISLGVVVYQLAMRLFIGNVLEKSLSQHFHLDRGWLKVTRREMRVYQTLRVKSWKKHLPTYDPSKYDIRKHSLDEIIHTMCCAELDHEMMFILSYLPIILTYLFGDGAVFVITSVLASLVEIPFIILQRFNRYRLVPLQARRRKA